MIDFQISLNVAELNDKTFTKTAGFFIFFDKKPDGEMCDFFKHWGNFSYFIGKPTV